MTWHDAGPRKQGGEPAGQDKLAEALDKLMQNPKLLGYLLLGLLAFIIVVWGILSSVYTVDVQESAVVLRLGRFAKGAEVGPGLHFKLPFGIDKVYKAKVEEIRKAEFGYRTITAGIDSTYQVESSLMLTGDLNVVNVRWVVRYKIDNLPNYIFNLRDPQTVVRYVSDAVMRQVVGDYSVDEVLTFGRQSIQTAAQDKMKALLDEYQAGIRIVGVRLQESSPPKEVQDAFRDVNRASQEKQRIVQEAEAERNRRIPAARGQKERVILEAEGYKIEKVNNAQGEVAEFAAVLERYLKAREITRRRLYLETMEKVLPRAGKKYIIQNAGDVLKLLQFQPTQKKGGM